MLSLVERIQLKFVISVACVIVSLASQVQANDVAVFTFEIPGLIQTDNQRPDGVAVDTIRMLFERAGHKPSFELHPFARVKSSVKTYANSCGFPVNYSTRREGIVDYMLPITLVRTKFYSLTQGTVSLSEIGDSYVVTLIEHTAKPQLESMDLSLLYVANADTAINLLLANRADFLVLDDSMANAASIEYGITLYPVYELAINATYLICNKQIEGLSQALLEQIFSDMLSDGSIRKIWQNYQLTNLYDDIFGVDGEKWQLLLNQFRIARGSVNDKTSAVLKGDD
jgi:hypothetical protein